MRIWRRLQAAYYCLQGCGVVFNVRFYREDTCTRLSSRDPDRLYLIEVARNGVEFREE